jgi:hypothetical protein
MLPPRPIIRYSGRIAVTISDEMSVIRLTEPRAMTLPPTAHPRWSRGGRSATRVVDRYITGSAAASYPCDINVHQPGSVWFGLLTPNKIGRLDIFAH